LGTDANRGELRIGSSREYTASRIDESSALSSSAADRARTPRSLLGADTDRR